MRWWARTTTRVFGYFLRLYLLGAMPPFAWGGDAVLSMVHVDALAEGLCLATANAPIGEYGDGISEGWCQDCGYREA